MLRAAQRVPESTLAGGKPESLRELMLLGRMGPAGDPGSALAAHLRIIVITQGAFFIRVILLLHVLLHVTSVKVVVD